MSKAKKVMLLLVEGITDSAALTSPLKNYFESNEVKVEQTDGDICYKDNETPATVVKTVNTYVCSYLDKQKLKKNNLLIVIHIIDTDGAFIGSERILKKDAGKIEYTESSISTCSPDKIIERNQKKHLLVNRLSTLEEIGGFKYRMYFFSRNLEHVLFNNPDELNTNDKLALADAFAERYENDAVGLLEFFQSDDLQMSCSYSDSWELIKQNANSLQRLTNFGQIFDLK